MSIVRGNRVVSGDDMLVVYDEGLSVLIVVLEGVAEGVCVLIECCSGILVIGCGMLLIFIWMDVLRQSVNSPMAATICKNAFGIGAMAMIWNWNTISCVLLHCS